jgi:hypothetical protein
MATTVDRTTLEKLEADANRQDAIAPELRIIESQNERIVRGAYSFRYQAPDTMLAELRQRYRLDEVIAGGQTEFDQILLLREWVHTRWKHGWTRVPEPRNAMEILAAVEQGKDFNCGYFAVTLMQCLLALGFVARNLSICKLESEWMSDDEGNIGHSIVEFWSHDYHKWILLDPDLNVHYERDSVPLSVLEIHEAWVSRRWDEVTMVTGPTPFRVTDKADSGAATTFINQDNQDAEFQIFGWHDVGDYYTHIVLPLHNTQHSSREHAGTLEWIDPWTPPRLIAYNRVNGSDFTSNVQDLYWTMDQVQIGLKVDQAAWERRKAVLEVTLEDSMPNLDKLLVRLDDEPWRETVPEFVWSLRPGKNQIMAKGVNSFGREGHVSRILLRFNP